MKAIAKTRTTGGLAQMVEKKELCEDMRITDVRVFPVANFGEDPGVGDDDER